MTETTSRPMFDGQHHQSNVKIEELEPKLTKSAQQAVQDALQAIHDRSYSGRHPELGKMINCQFCGLRHRENQNLRTGPCEQKFAVELVPPEGLTGLTARQVLGAAYFAKRRIRPHTNRWLNARKNHAAAVLRRKKNDPEEKVS